MKRINKVIVLSIYEYGYDYSIMEDSEIHNFEDVYSYPDGNLLREIFKRKFPEYFTVEELASYYPKNTLVIICDDGTIKSNYNDLKEIE